MDKNYGLTDKHGNTSKDKMPEWMDGILDEVNKPKGKKQHPFYGIDDPILNPKGLGLDRNK